MIVRRLARRIREHDWFAIAIELAVVVLGVFIGLQASNWNDQRVQDQRAVVFGERLQEDLFVEAWGYEMQVGYYSDVHDTSRRALDALMAKAPLPDEQLLVAAYRATQFNGNTRGRATYDVLCSRGEVGLVGAGSLREGALFV